MVWLWAGFIVFVIIMLFLDLGVLNRGAHEMSARRALAMTAGCVVLALAFTGVVFGIYEYNWFGAAQLQMDGAAMSGREAAIKYLTGWMVEYALSMDNIFVISVIFGYFQVPRAFQHRVLFWGILGALVFRGIMIGAGAALIQQFHWMIYVFGGLLILTGLKMLLSNDEMDPEHNWLVKLAVRRLPFTREYHGTRFVVRDHAGKLLCTPLFLVLIVVETTDVLFAVDSIPAIFAITRDPFLIFTSNVFAILGLRSLYFALAAIIDKFRYLKLSLVFVLLFVGVKMLISEVVHLSPVISLGVIAALLAGGVGASLWKNRREQIERPAPIEDLAEAAEFAWKRFTFARKAVIALMGFTVLVLAIPVGLLPGPGGIFVAIGGLMILATEFFWAKRLLKRMKDQATDLRHRAARMVGLEARFTQNESSDLRSAGEASDPAPHGAEAGGAGGAAARSSHGA